MSFNKLVFNVPKFRGTETQKIQYKRGSCSFSKTFSPSDDATHTLTLTQTSVAYAASVSVPFTVSGGTVSSVKAVKLNPLG